MTMKLLKLLGMLRISSGSVILLRGDPLFFSSTMLSPQPAHTQTEKNIDRYRMEYIQPVSSKEAFSGEQYMLLEECVIWALVCVKKWSKTTVEEQKGKGNVCTYSTTVCLHRSVWRRDSHSWGGTVVSLWDWPSPTAGWSHRSCRRMSADWKTVWEKLSFEKTFTSLQHLDSL